MENIFIYGLLGTEVNNGMFNADFTGGCRRDSRGNMVHSDVSLKYCFRNSWYLNYGKDSVLAFTKYDNNLNPLTLEKNYGDKFKKSTLKKDEVKQNLLTYKDVRNFGITFPVSNINMSLVGPVQIGWGKNINSEAFEKTIQISAPFATKAKKEKNEEIEEKDKGQTTLGTQNIVENALFVAPVVVTLNQDYTETDFNDFVEVSKTSVTNTQSRTMMGCNNAFSLFIKLNDSVITTDLLSNRVCLEDNILIFDFKDLHLKNVQLYVNLFKYEVKVINASIDVKVENLF